MSTRRTTLVIALCMAYSVPLRVQIPPGGSVAKASNATLVSWIRPKL